MLPVWPCYRRLHRILSYHYDQQMPLTLKIFFPFYSFTLTKVSLIVFLGNTAIIASAATMNFGLFLIVICSYHTYKNLYSIITKLSLLLTRVCYKFCLDAFNAGEILKSLVFICIHYSFHFILKPHSVNTIQDMDSIRKDGISILKPRLGEVGNF